MAKKDYAQAFAKFSTGVKVAKIKALDNAEIQYRELTMLESDEFINRFIKEVNEDGSPKFDIEEAMQVKYEKVALILIEPKMTVEDLRALPASASDAINEIIALVDISEADLSDEEGNVKA